ncbi:MAG TPA: DUF192 domain-containing protein [Pusillimonas sp.]
MTTARYAMHAPDFNHASAISPRRLQLFVARTFRQRLQGLHAYPKLSWHTGLCIRPCNAIHTFGLTYAIDVIFLDRRGRIVKRVDRLLPWRVAICLKAACAVELPAGYCAAYPDFAQRIRVAMHGVRAQRRGDIIAPTDDSRRTR